MTERPMLFSAPMVRAILGGLKTQTRRVVKWPQASHACGEVGTCCETIWREADGGFYCGTCGAGVSSAFKTAGEIVLRPPIARGDRIWVRETLKRGAGRRWAYGADGAPVTLFEGDPQVPAMTAWAAHKEGNTCVSIHMPRWASRLLLEVVDVRIERLKDCCEADATAEGSQEPTLVPIIGVGWSSRDLYAKLWEHINGAGSWAANPWVWVYTFKRVQP